MRLLYTFFLFVLSLPSVIAQATGTINYENLGLSFTIPEGWVGQETQIGYLMGSNTVPGMVLLIPHDQPYSVSEIESQLKAGIQDMNGTNLQLNGSITTTENAAGGEFSGTMEFQPVKAYILGLQNPHGNGMSIIAVTTPQLFGPQYQSLAEQVMLTVEFSKPAVAQSTATQQASNGESIEEWKVWMQNVKLTYMESYTSISPGASGMTGGGYSFSKEIDLCGEGYFKFYGNSSISVGSDVSSGLSGSSNRGNGTWDIRKSSNGHPELVLNFNNGQSTSYVLTYEDKKLYLDGTRYFRTFKGDYAPSCP